MRNPKSEIVLRDALTGEELARALLTPSRVKALIRAYSLAGIDAVAV
jgi:hypothetical protein